MRHEIEELINSVESAYSIGKGSGVDPSVIQRIRLGKRKIGNLTLDTAEKLFNYHQSQNNPTSD